jgi:PTS system N-acetylglucosamine-specific IIC component
LLLFPVGLAYFAIYYGVFRWAIARFDLKTPGREDETPSVAPAIAAGDRGGAFASALGGSANLLSVDACTTRLRLVLVNPANVDEAQLRALGARGIVRPSHATMQVVLGPIADQVAGEIRDAAAVPGSAPLAANDAASAAVALPRDAGAIDAGSWLAALGGRQNIRGGGLCGSRLYLTLGDAGSVDEAELQRLGVRAFARPAPSSLHLVIGPAAGTVALALGLPVLVRA